VIRAGLMGSRIGRLQRVPMADPGAGGPFCFQKLRVVLFRCPEDEVGQRCGCDSHHPFTDPAVSPPTR
jgi:hypothetical protein